LSEPLDACHLGVIMMIKIIRGRIVMYQIIQVIPGLAVIITDK
jgi:hypothetical protein